MFEVFKNMLPEEVMICIHDEEGNKTFKRVKAGQTLYGNKILHRVVLIGRVSNLDKKTLKKCK